MAVVAGLLEFFYCNNTENSLVQLSAESLKDCKDDMPLIEKNRHDLRVAALEYVHIHGIRKHEGYVQGNCQLKDASNKLPVFEFNFLEKTRTPIIMRVVEFFGILAAKLASNGPIIHLGKEHGVDIYGCKTEEGVRHPTFDVIYETYDVLVVGFDVLKSFCIVKHTYGKEFGGDEHGFMHIKLDLGENSYSNSADNCCQITKVQFLNAENQIKRVKKV